MRKMSDELEVKGLIGQGAYGKVFLLENAGGTKVNDIFMSPFISVKTDKENIIQMKTPQD